MEISSQQRPSRLIKPIKFLQTKPIDKENIKRYRIYNLKNLKKTYSSLSNDLSMRYMKHSAKILQSQDKISNIRCSLEEKTAFQHTYFSSNLRKISASLSSFTLKTWDYIDEAKSKVVFRSLNHLKNLQDFEIRLEWCQIPATSDLHSLFNRLLYFKKLKYFSFYTSRCQGFEAKHMKALCSSLTRLPWLQSLSLSLNGGDEFLDMLIPSLSKLLSLKKINLRFERNNSFQAKTLIKFFMTLSTLKNLTDITLSLTSCQVAFEETAPEPLAEGLQYLKPSSIRKLTLDLSQNLTEKGLVQISEALKRFTSLQILDLKLPDSKDFFHDRLSQLSSTLIDLTSLSSLGLTFPGFTKDLAEAFKSLQRLAHLRLHFQNPNPSPDQIQLLSSSLKELKSSLKFLEIIFAFQSSLSDSFIENLAEALKELTLLKHLFFSFPYASGITSREVETLFLAIQGLSNLSSLGLLFQNNKEIDENIVNVLSQALQGLPSLSSIRLEFSRYDKIDLEERDLQRFFAILGKMKNLSQFDLELPRFKYRPQELMELKQRFALRIYKTEDCLQIIAL